MHEERTEQLEVVANRIVDSAVRIHRTFGPGLLESAYQKCLTHDLQKQGFHVDCEVTLPITYDGMKIETGYRIDMLVDSCVIIENKTVDQILPIHTAQLLTYMRLSEIRLGFILNWRSTLMKTGIKRIVI